MLVVAARRRGHWWLAAAAACVVALVASAHTHDRWDGPARAAAAAHESVAFRAVVLREPYAVTAGAREQRWAVRLRLAEVCVGSPPCTWRPSGEDIVAYGPEWSRVAFGEAIEGHGELTPGWEATTAAVAFDAAVDAVGPAPWPARAVTRARDGLRAAAQSLPPRTRGLVVGMAIGDTSEMSPLLARDMRVTSLAHLTAVSGAHFAVIAVALGAAIRALRLPRPWRALLLAAVMAGFVAVVFPDPSVVRAAWMGGVLAAALWWGRPAQALPALASAVVGLLLYDPALALSLGFALSVAATAAIAVWSPLVALALERFLVPRLARALSVPIAAQAACVPILILINPGIGAYGVLANVLAVPFAAVVTLVAVSAIPLAMVCPPCASAMVAVAGLAAEPVVLVARTLGRAPGAWLAWPPGMVGASLAGVIVLASMAATAARRFRAYYRLAGVLVVTALVAASPPVQGAVGSAVTVPSGWVLAACDVGQGDMLLIRAGPSAAVVVDTGPTLTDAARCLRVFGVRQAPLLVITHPHADHDGGVGGVLGMVPVGEAWVSPTTTLLGRRAAVGELAAAGVAVQVPKSGASVTVGEVSLRVWREPLEPRSDPQDNTLINDSSLVLFGQVSGVAFALLGDLETDAQAALLQSAPPRVDVVKVAHHGSARQDARLASVLRGRVAIVSVGAGNPYGHPDPTTLANYRAAGSQVLTTMDCGDVSIVPGEPPRAYAACGPDVAGWGHGTDTGSGATLVAGGPGAPGVGVGTRAAARVARRGPDLGGRAQVARVGFHDAAVRAHRGGRGPPVRGEPVAL